MSDTGAAESLVDVATKAMAGALIVGMAALATAIGLLFSQIGVPKGSEQFGQFGDFVGGVVNPVVGVLTLFALTLTVIMQARQLSLSRQELLATRAELARSAEAQEVSTKLMAEQLTAAKDAATAQHWAADAQARSAEALATQARQAGHAAHIAALNSALAAVAREVDRFDSQRRHAEGVYLREPANVTNARERQGKLLAEIEVFTDRLLGRESFEFDNGPKDVDGG